MPLDYSKWKDIEVSDDEDDTHPNIDTPSLFRWRHQARLERMAVREQERTQISKGKSSVEKRMQEIEEKLKSAQLEEKERMKLELEMNDVKRQEEEYLKKEKELEEKERLEPWNVDTIGHEAFSSSRINKITPKKPETPKMSEEEETKRMADYFQANEELLKEFGRLKGLDASEKFLLEHPHLASEFAANFLTVGTGEYGRLIGVSKRQRMVNGIPTLTKGHVISVCRGSRRQANAKPYNITLL
uniref:Hsp90 co-chaperone cdc37 n=1 Tax=Ascaris suum TaxID=6253 RepID=F1LC25_ASCSU